MAAPSNPLGQMASDLDFAAEAETLDAVLKGMTIISQTSHTSPSPQSSAETPSIRHVRLNWYMGQGGHNFNEDTQSLLLEAGGQDAIANFTKIFYQKVFADPHLDKFIRDRTDPHGERFASWAAEKFGDMAMPWTVERSSRKTCPFSSHGRNFVTPHDRSSAHYAAWHSPKREESKFGNHFNLEDCRVWMRLHFWALRESGMFVQSPSFVEYYIKFIGHFVSVYERQAPPFARESARWSADPANIKRYIDNDRKMEDLHGLSLIDAQAQLPKAEAESHGDWPYC